MANSKQFEKKWPTPEAYSNTKPKYKMRKTRRFILRLLFLVLVIYISHSIWISFLADSFGVSTTFLKETSSSFLYRLEPEQELTFSFPACKRLKIITNAALPLNTKPRPGQTFPYAFQYQLLAIDGHVLVTRDYHQSATLTQYQDRRTHEAVLTSFFSEPNADTPNATIPLDGKVMQINFKGIDTIPRQIRIKQKFLTPPLTTIYVRLYWELDYPSSRWGILWKRKSKKNKMALAEGNIYPLELLNDQEKLLLASNKWEVIAPTGVPGKNFQRDTMYSLEQEYIDNRLEPIVLGIEEIRTNVNEWVVQPGLRGILPLPAAGGHFLIQFFPITPPPYLSETPPIRLIWYGRKPGEQQTYSVLLNQKPAIPLTWENNLNGGLIEIISPITMTAKLFILPATSVEKEEITPSPTGLKTYQLNTNQPQEYHVFHPKGEVIPYRVDLRSILVKNVPFAQNTSSAEVRYQCINKNNQIISEDNLTVPQLPSLYDRIGQNNVSVGEKISYYLSIPASVSILRFFSMDSPVLVSLYNRPDDLASRIQVPEDYFAYERQDNLIKDWFYVSPANFKALQEQGRLVNVFTQTRPPQLDPRLVSGEYQWDTLLPDELTETSLRMLFVPRDSSMPLRDQTGGQWFQAIPTHKKLSLTFLMSEGDNKNRIYTDIVYLKEKPNPALLTVFLDNQSLWQGRIFGTQGELSLPPLTPGLHTISCETETGIKLFINKTVKTGEQIYLKRAGVALATQRLTFQYEKLHSEENLSFRLFAPSQSTTPASLAVSITNIRRNTGIPFKNWTLAQRQFQVKPAGLEFYPVLRTMNEKIDAGQPLFFPLNEDVPIGKYSIQVNFEGGKGYYLVLNRLVRGSFQGSEMHIQQNNKPTEKQWTISRHWEEARQKGSFRQLTSTECTEARGIFRALLSLAEKPSEKIRSSCENMGFQLVTIPLAEKSSSPSFIIILKEKEEQKQGRGFYVFRPGVAAPLPILLQIPHSFNDKDTGEIGFNLFLEQKVRAVAFNTVSRDTVDFAHSKNTLFQVLNDEFAIMFPSGRIMQIHGFANDKRNGVAGQKASLILSNGTSTPSTSLLEMVSCLNAGAFSGVYLYPRDIRDLGGITNTQAQSLRAMEFKGFLHIEINSLWRQQLKEDSQLRKAFFHCIGVL